jgi:glycosyltransferase involved in cell wall biosynthesis
LVGDNELGILVSPGDSQSLADGLLAILQDPKARTQMAQAARVRRKQWYWDRLVHEFVRVYDIAA